jgi:hypothetical protein
MDNLIVNILLPHGFQKITLNNIQDFVDLQQQLGKSI